jgi:hypothetical protein
MLNLHYNEIGDEGAECLANVMERNTVSYSLCLSIIFPESLINIDTHYIESSRKPNQR